MLGTNATPYDVRFRVLDIPVRIHPGFWLISVILGWHDNNLPVVALWVLCVLISILVHEYGHGLMAQRFGDSPSILLYSLGGLCFSGPERSPTRRLAILFAGPGAGFILLAGFLVVMSLVYGISPTEHLAMIRALTGLGVDRGSMASLVTKLPNEPMWWFYEFMVYVNFFWGLVNLLPIYPLDGGQAAQVVMSQMDRRHGARRSHIVSLVTAGVLGIASVAWSRSAEGRPDYYLLLFFGCLAMINYQMLQSYHIAHTRGMDSDDDFWRH